MVSAQLKELLLQSLEQERGGVLIYRAALECVVNDELKQEWTKYLNQTRRHVEVLSNACTVLGLDPSGITPGCKVVHHTGTSLVMAMRMALAQGDASAAERVACDCVMLAETQDHADWRLIGAYAKAFEGDAASLLRAAHGEIEEEEDEHLRHSLSWRRELWLKALGLPALLPPPDEKKLPGNPIAPGRAEGRSVAERKH
jgi:hypothetical protein